MKKLLICFPAIMIAVVSRAQIISAKDPQIEKMVSAVSKDSLQSYVKAMVSFGTRNTLITKALRGFEDLFAPDPCKVSEW